jgi:hypothetical protein
MKGSDQLTQEDQDKSGEVKFNQRLGHIKNNSWKFHSHTIPGKMKHKYTALSWEFDWQVWRKGKGKKEANMSTIIRDSKESFHEGSSSNV